MAMEDDLREIRTRISQAQQKQARAQAEHDAAVDRRSVAKKSLKDDFGVETKEEITAKLQELNDELVATKEQIEAALQEAGA